MRYIDPRLLVPVVAATALAQQQSPEAAAAEAGLRARVQEFFQLQVEKKYRQAEALVAEDSKDAYYDEKKFNIRNFTIEKIELFDNNTKAKVTIKAGVTLLIPAAGRTLDLDAPATTLWKIDHDQWTYYVEPGTKIVTPFGSLDARGPGAPPASNMVGKAPDIATLQSAVKADRDAVILTATEPEQSITVTNSLPGAVDLSLNGDRIDGFTVEIRKTRLEAGEKTEVVFSAKGEGHEARIVPILVSPIGAQLNIQVTKR